MSVKAITSEEKIAHLYKSFDSTQDLIKFLDTKTNIVIGISSVAAGFAITLAKWLFELPGANIASLASVAAKHQYWLYLDVVVFGLSLVAFLFSISFAVWTVVSRSAIPGELTLIFPVQRSGIADLRKAVKESISELSLPAIYAEFEDQLFRLGQIIGRKHSFLQCSTVCLLAQFLFLVVTVVLYAAIVIW